MVLWNTSKHGEKSAKTFVMFVRRGSKTRVVVALRRRRHRHGLSGDRTCGLRGWLFFRVFCLSTWSPCKQPPWTTDASYRREFCRLTRRRHFKLTCVHQCRQVCLTCVVKICKVNRERYFGMFHMNLLWYLRITKRKISTIMCLNK